MNTSFNTFSVHAIFNRLRLLPNHIRKAILNLNLFESQRPGTPTDIFREQLLTRLFLLLLIISSIAAGFYTFLVVQNQVVTIAHPSFPIYQQLYNDYSDTLQCPCSQLAVPYGTFLNVTFVLHQVCSSDLISSVWLNYLESFDPVLLPSWIGNIVVDFRSTGDSYFQLLSIFCSLSKKNIDDAQSLFINNQLVNDHLPTPLFFTQQTQAIIDSYITDTKNNFQRTLDWIIVTFNSNYLFSGANINFAITVTKNDTVVVENAVYIVAILTHTMYSGIHICTCPRESSQCFQENVLYINASSIYEFEQIFWELPVSCTPFTGILKSTFLWWYNESYLNNIKATYAIVLPSKPPPNISSLNSAVPSRFTNNTLLYMVEEMFLERWISNDTRFNQFYSQCAPSSCSYTVTRRRDLLLVLLLLISICGGLNKILRILVRGFGQAILFLIDWWQNRNIQHRK